MLPRRLVPASLRQMGEQLANIGKRPEIHYLTKEMLHRPVKGDEMKSGVRALGVVSGWTLALCCRFSYAALRMQK